MKPQRENEVTQNFLGLREGLGAFEDGVGNRNPRLVPMQHVGMGLWVGFGRDSGGNESGASLPAPTEMSMLSLPRKFRCHLPSRALQCTPRIRNVTSPKGQRRLQ